AAARVADGEPVQSRRLSHQRLPLELLRNCRRERFREPRHDGAVPRRLPGDYLVDIQDGVSAEKISVGRHSLAPAKAGGAIAASYSPMPMFSRSIMRTIIVRRGSKDRSRKPHFA